MNKQTDSYGVDCHKCYVIGVFGVRDTEVADRLIETVRELDRLGFAPAATGNVSVRVDTGRVAITPSGVPYNTLIAEHIVVVDLAGQVVEGQLEPSSDTPMHLAVYRARSDAGSVLHCHSPAATTLACLGWRLPPVHYMTPSLSPDGWVNVAPYAAYGTDTAAQNAVAALGSKRRACLLGHHGVLCLADDPAQVLSRAITLESVAGIYQRMRALVGDPPMLTSDEIDEAARKLDRYGEVNRSQLVS